MNKNGNPEFINQFKDLLSLHERTLKYLESNKIDAVLIQNYKKLQFYLRNLSDDEICTILNTKSKKSPLANVLPINELEDHEIERLTTEQVNKEILKDRISKQYLERIARIRFGVSKSSASGLNRESLIEKLNVLISNEQTHETIAQLASGNELKSE